MAFQRGSEAALVADRGGERAPGQLAAERVVDLDALADRLGERRRAVRYDHELLEVEIVVGVPAAVDHVHQRHGKQGGGIAPQRAVERRPARRGGRARRRERDREERVGAELALVLGAVERDQRARRRAPDRASSPISAGASTSFTFATARLTPLPAAAPGIAVAQLDRLALAGRRPRRNRRGAARRRRRATPSPRRWGSRASRESRARGRVRSSPLLSPRPGLGRAAGRRAQDHDPDLGQQRQHRDDALDAQPGACRLRRQLAPREPRAASSRSTRACAARRAGSSSRCRDGRWSRPRGPRASSASVRSTRGRMSGGRCIMKRLLTTASTLRARHGGCSRSART